MFSIISLFFGVRGDINTSAKKGTVGWEDLMVNFPKKILYFIGDGNFPYPFEWRSLFLSVLIPTKEVVNTLAREDAIGIQSLDDSVMEDIRIGKDGIVDGVDYFLRYIKR